MSFPRKRGSGKGTQDHAIAGRPPKQAGSPAYRPLVAAQAAAYLLVLGGGAMDKLKLAKLLYLAERESIRRWAEPLMRDRLFSLPHGPICSEALDGLDGDADQEIWNFYIERSDNTISVAAEARDSQFEWLSDAAIAILDDVNDAFGKKTTSAIRTDTHELPEYEETASKAIPISDEAVAKAVGLPDPRAYAETMASLRSNPVPRARR